MIKIVEAVSAVFCFQGQIFSVIRQNHLDVFPGYNAFPGGKIDDQDLPSRIASSVPKLNSVHLSALCRAMKEELSFDLEKAFAEDKIISIEPLAEIFAPSFAQIRFRNWFYRIDLKDGVCATSAGHGATQSLPRLIKGSRPGTCSCLGGLIAVYGCGHTNERLQLKPLLGVSTGKRHLSRVPSNNFDRDVPVEFCISELVPSMDPVLARLNL